MLENKKKMLSRVGKIFIFIIGFLIMFYPFYINALNNFIAEYTVMRYQKEQASNFEKKKAELELENEKLKKDGLNPGSDPFKEEQKIIKKDAELKEHVIGKINIPKLSLEIPLFDKTTPYLLEHGASVLDGTSFPVGGEGTHSVISAHRGLPNRELFTNLPNLKEKDIFLVEVFDEVLAYEVESIQVVTPEETSVIESVPGQDLITLITCTPYMINTHRLLVTGHRVPYTPDIKKEKEKHDVLRKIMRLAIIVGTILISLDAIFLIYRQWQLYQLSRKKMTLKFIIKSKNKKRKLSVSLFDKKGKLPVQRNNKDFCFSVFPDEVVTFKDIPAGLYRVKVNDKMIGPFGLKKMTQAKTSSYEKEIKIKGTKNNIHVIYKNARK